MGCAPTSAHLSNELPPHRRVVLTSVADMPGYPTKKLLLGGPETRTKAAMVTTQPRGQLQAKGGVSVCEIGGEGHRRCWRATAGLAASRL